jgi:hypothetical protein
MHELRSEQSDIQTRGDVCISLSLLSFHHEAFIQHDHTSFSTWSRRRDTFPTRHPLPTCFSTDLSRAVPCPLSQDELTVVNARSEEIWERIDREVEDTTTGEILNKMIDVVKHTLRTNIY